MLAKQDVHSVLYFLNCRVFYKYSYQILSSDLNIVHQIILFICKILGEENFSKNIFLHNCWYCYEFSFCNVFPWTMKARQDIYFHLSSLLCNCICLQMSSCLVIVFIFFDMVWYPIFLCANICSFYILFEYEKTSGGISYSLGQILWWISY